MPKLIRNNEVRDYPWQVQTEESAAAADLSTGQHLIPLNVWLTHQETLGENVGIILPTDTDPSAITEAVIQAKVIAIEFSAFADGRGFSLARILREDFDFKGELQAAGGFMQDQLLYLKRCGFDSYVIADEADAESMLGSLSDFSNSYQASSDEPRPLFRRR